MGHLCLKINMRRNNTIIRVNILRSLILLFLSRDIVSLLTGHGHAPMIDWFAHSLTELFDIESFNRRAAVLFCFGTDLEITSDGSKTLKLISPVSGAQPHSFGLRLVGRALRPVRPRVGSDLGEGVFPKRAGSSGEKLLTAWIHLQLT
jgi:hypothetical protein